MLHYVNAGHGFATVRRADGEMVALAARSLPVGAGDQEYTEGEVRLEPGDVLLVYTNGLVEVADGNADASTASPGPSGSRVCAGAPG